MTTYHGGKKKISKYISNEIIKVCELYINNGFMIKGYFEPFCGMCSIYDKMIDYFNLASIGESGKIKFIANDINKSVILMWKNVQNGWKPPLKCSKDEYYKLKYDNKASAEKGFIGHVFSFRGTYFDTYFKHRESKIRTNYDNVISLGNKFNKVHYYNKSYDDKQFSKLKNFVIYCDPPYFGGQQRYYKGHETSFSEKLDFDTDNFWKWCKKMAKNNIVIVSEYSAPNDDKIVKIFTIEKENLYVVLP
jgi:site-specific DNA-adenine methylase